jgi:hypothetical protein
MWKAQLKVGTVNTVQSNIPTKPKKEDCCENAKNKWKVYVGGAAPSGSEILRFKEKYGYNFNRDSEKDCILMYNQELLFNQADKDCITFRKFLKDSGSPKKKEVLNEWYRCEGR